MRLISRSGARGFRACDLGRHRGNSFQTYRVGVCVRRIRQMMEQNCMQNHFEQYRFHVHYRIFGRCYRLISLQFHFVCLIFSEILEPRPFVS